MNKSKLLTIELILLFICIPIILVINISLYIKLLVPLIGVIYCSIVILKNKLISFSDLYKIKSKKVWKPLVIKTFILIILSSISMFLFNEEKLFLVIKNNPVLWLSVCFFYSVFSVLPQELLYRSFFFKRYSVLFKNTTFLILINALLFSLAHTLFLNIYISALTLIGGFAFALTYQKNKSLLFTSIEHAIYGCWIFTLGIGEYLGFPIGH